MKFLRRLFFFSLLSGMLAGIVYLQSDVFSLKWRRFVVEQLATRGIYLTLDRLSLDPLEGVVAQNVRLYQDKNHGVLLASLNKLTLDVDYSKALQKQIFIEGLDLRNASVAFPIDPDDPKSEVLELKNFSARLFLMGDRMDIRKAEGDLYGLRVNITGSLLRPPLSTDPDDEVKAEELRKKRLALLKARRAAIVEVTRIMRHFETATAPTLNIDVTGDMEKPEDISAKLHLTAGGMRHGAYRCKELEAVATYASESIDLSRLYLKDEVGDLELSASHQIGTESVDFHLRSSANLLGLAAAIFENDALHEVVFYETPELTANGQFLFGQSEPKDAFVPVRCTGKIHAGRFASRGEVINGLDLNFGLAPEGCYLRDFFIRHKTGTLSLKAMWKKSEGLHYKGLLQMDPNVFMPFVNLPETKAILARFEFRDESSIFAEVEGNSPTTDIHDGPNSGRIELHNLKYQGQEFKRLEANVAFTGETHTYTDLQVYRAEGHATAEEVHCDDSVQTVRLKNVVSDLDPVALVGCFAKDTADVIAHYRFDKHPHCEVSGLISQTGDTSMHVKFRSEGTAHYMLWGDDYTISRPAGDLTFKGPMLNYDVTGSLFNKAMSARGTANLEPKANDYTVSFKAGLFPYEVFGKPLPFADLNTQVVCKRGIADFDVKAKVFDGGFSMKGTIDDNKDPQPYKGELRIDAVSFVKFARVYSPENDTEGDLTGHVSFTGKLGNWRSLKGQGALVLLNGNLYAVPILGPLTPLLGALLPRPIKGYNIAKEADATFSIADGFAETQDLEALTAVFRLVVKGKVDFIEDRIQFHAQSKFRGLPGLVLFPVSTILEYTGEGTVGDPVWRPRYFSGSSEKTEFRKSEEPANVPKKESGPVFNRPSGPVRAGR
jgi:hypothetical protein